MGALQNCAAIVSKCSSDIVAAVIEGFADRNMYLRMRTLEYDSKFSQIFSNLVKLALLFPQATIRRLLQEQPREFWQQLLAKDPNAARQAIVHLLDLMYMWYYLPRSHDIFWRRLSSMPTEEVEGILALHSPAAPAARDIHTGAGRPAGGQLRQRAGLLSAPARQLPQRDPARGRPPGLFAEKAA